MDTTDIQVRDCDDGRREVLDPVRKRWVALSAITVNGQTRRCDIVVFATDGQPRIIVECKRPDVPINQKVCDQACRYNTVLQVPFLLLTNGRQQIIIEIDYRQRSLRQLSDLPLFLNNVKP